MGRTLDYLVLLVRDKRSSLLKTFTIYGRKKRNKRWPLSVENSTLDPEGATAFSIAAHSLMPLSITTLSICDIQHNDTQHNTIKIGIMLSVAIYVLLS
jgi:hypothetical protein